MIIFLQLILISNLFTKNNPLCTDHQLFWKYKCLFVTVAMVVDSSQPPIYFVILPCVLLTTHFDEDGNESLTIQTRFLASWLETYLTSMNKLTVPVT